MNSSDTVVDMGAHTFPNSICLKVKVIAQLEFKLVYFEATIQYSHYYAMGNPLEKFKAN